MSWVTIPEVSALLGQDLTGDEFIDRLISHAQALIVAEIGEVDDPVPAGLPAIAAQVSARLWRAAQAARSNPAGNQQETLGPFNYSAGRFEAGWGLTRTEKEQLRRFRSGLWVQPTTHGHLLETAGLVDDAAGGDPILYYAHDDLPH